MQQAEYFNKLQCNYVLEKPEYKKKRIREYEQTDVVELVDIFIEEANRLGASDIHIEPRINERVYVRFRIEGNMVDHCTLPLSVRESIVSRIKILANMDISEKRKPQDGKMSITLNESKNQLNLRIATFPTAGSMEDVVMRLLPNEKPLQLDSIGLHPRNLKDVVEMVNNPYGMIFVCGPTGSGKTTTLHSILNYLNVPERKIWTAEDPVEITQEGLRQVQISKQVDYATVLRSFLRGDPDVIMIGEMRDIESANIAIEASLTGHLVLSTIHTNTAPETVSRIINMGISTFTLADSLLGVIAQRLCRKLCVKCKEEYYPENNEIFELIKMYCNEVVTTQAYNENPKEFSNNLYKFWQANYSDFGKIKLYKPRGCIKCNQGYKGRVGVHELLIASDDFKRAVANKKATEELKTIALNEGMLTLRMDGIFKVLEGTIDMSQLDIICK